MCQYIAEEPLSIFASKKIRRYLDAFPQSIICAPACQQRQVSGYFPEIYFLN